eukprot:SAG25_NODE_3776_length_974_cov_0.710857_1_plen_23_part_10
MAVAVGEVAGVAVVVAAAAAGGA